MEYLHFYIKSGTATLTPTYDKRCLTLQYSYNKTDWTTATTNSSIDLVPDKKVYFKGTISGGLGLESIINFKATGSPLYAGGSIMSLQDGNPDETTIKYPSEFYGMFSNCTSLITTPELPATTITPYCYRGMFLGCTSIKTAPKLPAKTLAASSYSYMFQNCTSLTTAPELPATTLAQHCYQGIFLDCKSLVNAPALPATTLEYSCYRDMFLNCTSLVTAPELPATTLVEDCYYEMFQGCTDLVTAPELPATEPAVNCYKEMFLYCSKLNYVKCLLKPNTIVCTTDWLSGASITGTFVKNNEANNWERNDSGIPVDWTVENYQPTVINYTLTLQGDNCTLNGGGTYNEGTTVEISCVPNTGYYFVRWSDGNTNATRTITVTEDITLTAITAQGSSEYLEIKARKGSGEYERTNIIWYLDYKVNNFIWDARVYTDFDNLTTNFEISDDRVTNISKGSSWIGDSRIYSFDMTVPRNDSDTNKEFTITITSTNGILSDTITIRVIQKPKLPVLIEDIFVSSGDVENALVTIPDTMGEVLVVYEDETLARYTIDDCVSNYVLYYRNALGGIDLFPVTGKVIKSNDIEHLTINKKYDNRTLNFGKTNYENVLTERWQLYSGRLTDQQSKLMHHLINSTYVYLYDIQADKFTPVVITDTEMEYKTYKNNNNKMVYYTINVEASQTKYRR